MRSEGSATHAFRERLYSVLLDTPSAERVSQFLDHSSYEFQLSKKSYVHGHGMRTDKRAPTLPFSNQILYTPQLFPSFSELLTLMFQDIALNNDEVALYLPQYRTDSQRRVEEEDASNSRVEILHKWLTDNVFAP